MAGEGKDFLAYTTLTYANGPGYNYYIKDGHILRPDPKHLDTSAFSYKQQAAINKNIESHGGEDVGIYASGTLDTDSFTSLRLKLIYQNQFHNISNVTTMF